MKDTFCLTLFIFSKETCLWLFRLFSNKFHPCFELGNLSTEIGIFAHHFSILFYRFFIVLRFMSHKYRKKPASSSSELNCIFSCDKVVRKSVTVTRFSIFLDWDWYNDFMTSLQLKRHHLQLIELTEMKFYVILVQYIKMTSSSKTKSALVTSLIVSLACYGVHDVIIRSTTSKLLNNFLNDVIIKILKRF